MIFTSSSSLEKEKKRVSDTIKMQGKVTAATTHKDYHRNNRQYFHTDLLFGIRSNNVMWGGCQFSGSEKKLFRSKCSRVPNGGNSIKLHKTQM